MVHPDQWADLISFYGVLGLVVLVCAAIDLWQRWRR